ncbi:alpha/beta hydrolase [Cellulomonas sp.]|uniref:alpha/beta hydrolase n=1 Tax=Cellulomonas sp. TaxID=40001 RepID=UPI0028119679|nr:alpha/beta hydrolase [Cellulomonas sp.]
MSDADLPPALEGRVAVVPAAAAGPRPLVLVLPGGGYRRTADHEAEPVAHWLAGLALHAVVLRYPVAPEGSTTPVHPAPLDAAAAAVRWVRAGGTGLDVDPARVAVLGFSAGGHLAATLSTVVDDAARPDATVLCYPVVSFRADAHEGSVAALLGPEAGDDDRAALSAELRVTSATPPAFVWHTADDATVPVSNAVRYAQALWGAGVPAELHVYPSGRHGLGLAGEEPHVAAWTDACAAWFAHLGWRGARV